MFGWVCKAWNPIYETLRLVGLFATRIRPLRTALPLPLDHVPFVTASWADKQVAHNAPERKRQRVLIGSGW